MTWLKVVTDMLISFKTLLFKRRISMSATSFRSSVLTLRHSYLNKHDASEGVMNCQASVRLRHSLATCTYLLQEVPSAYLLAPDLESLYPIELYDRLSVVPEVLTEGHSLMDKLLDCVELLRYTTSTSC
jgi:hypothetical protein